ncbi:hypothetical protein LOK49_LG09G00427 [Camellia lanceoleosa]|uniref:Uncharacterized protein n=1 Tax=Camellia lanceoleosa TaxID=1840588 RepID=A0ACC0GIF8_9ERIC|nr:hypothetical protein LOK49_LG09G00427 [Camellia lanceoleosa]
MGSTKGSDRLWHRDPFDLFHNLADVHFAADSGNPTYTYSKLLIIFLCDLCVY